MNAAVLNPCAPGPVRSWTDAQLEALNPCQEKRTAAERIQWALQFLPEQAILTSSFGAQSAVMLHLATRLKPGLPVVLIDTGYLFEETYRFIDRLVGQLDINLQVYSPRISPAWQEARFGRRWAQGAEGIHDYNQMNKVEPMARALRDLRAGTWFSGLRRVQSDTRRGFSVLQRHGQTIKVCPIVDWTNRDIHRYLQAHALPYHPLWEQGYVSIGDRHSSRPLGPGMTEQDTRFSGFTRECGLHQPERFRNAAG